MGDPMTEVEGSLVALTQDEGLTNSRLVVHGEPIFKFLGPASADYVRDQIVTAIGAIEQNDYTKALRNALALDYEVQTTLSQRRAKLLEDVGFPDISEATLRRWERKAVQQLAFELMMNGSYRADKSRKIGLPDDIRAAAATTMNMTPAEVDEHILKGRTNISILDALKERDGDAVLLTLDRIEGQVNEQTALLREINESLKALAGGNKQAADIQEPPKPSGIRYVDTYED